MKDERKVAWAVFGVSFVALLFVLAQLPEFVAAIIFLPAIAGCGILSEFVAKRIAR